MSVEAVTVMVPNVLPEDGEPEPVEAAISEAASLVAGYSRSGWAVGLRTPVGQVSPGQGPAHLRSIFGHLARVELVESDEVPTPEPGDGVLRSGEGAVLVRHPNQPVPRAWAGRASLGPPRTVGSRTVSVHPANTPEAQPQGNLASNRCRSCPPSTRPGGLSRSHR